MPISTKRATMTQPQKLVPATFNRTTVAYNSYGESVTVGTPRFQIREGKSGVLIEEGTTNLLTSNQSNGGSDELLTLNQQQGTDVELLTDNQRTGTDTLGNTVGFNVNTNTVISSSTEQFNDGTRSLKTITGGIATNEGSYVYITPVAGVTYTFSTWVYAPNGSTLRLLLAGAGASNVLLNFTGNGGWQKISGSITAISTVTLACCIYTAGTPQAITFYVDSLSLTGTTGFVLNRGDAINEIISSSSDYAYTGTKSLKCVTGGANAVEGVKINNTSVSGVAYTGTAMVKAPVNASMSLYVGSGTPFDFIGTGDWQYIKYTATATGGTTILTVCTKTAQALTFYVDSLSLKGTTGFSAQGSGTVSLSVDLTEKYQGNNSIKCVTDGGAAAQGIKTSATIVSPSTSYTATFWFKGTGNIEAVLQEQTSGAGWVANNTYNFVGTGNWQQIKITGTMGTTGARAVLLIYTNGTFATTFYVDMLQLEQKAYPTSWTLGGTTRVAETLTIPSSVLNLQSGSIECEFYIPDQIPGHIGMFVKHASGVDNLNRISIGIATTPVLRGRTGDNSGNQSNREGTVNVSIGWHKGSIVWDNSEMKLFLDSVQVGNTINNPYLPTVSDILAIGGSPYEASYKCNTLIRNVCISKTKRSDTDISARALADYPIDSAVSYKAYYEGDLKGVART